MDTFIDKDFLLYTDTAKKLYHNHAEKLPIIDYHCHLSPRDIAEDRKFENITRLWLEGDHYKWRAMRIAGVDEKYITGDAPDHEKFLRWAETVPHTIGNPLYHWSHLELYRYFGIERLIDPSTCQYIWEETEKLLGKDSYSARGLISGSDVEVAFTTDDILDSLKHHKKIIEGSFKTKVYPTLRNDRCINIDGDLMTFTEKLGKVTGTNIKDLDDFKAAAAQRIEYFASTGCRISDHAMEDLVFYQSKESEAKKIFKEALKGRTLEKKEKDIIRSHMLIFLGKIYAEKGWVMQLHIGAIRNVSSRMSEKLGPDTGFDSIGDSMYAKDLARLLDSLDSVDKLPRTILYCLNPGDNYILSTLIGCFTQTGIKGKIQLGPAWWFNDHKDGMERHMKDLGNLSLLSSFIGMTTDSRSFLSYPRHEYFRRIICNRLGIWAENGEAPSNTDVLGKMVEDICYFNAKRYLGMDTD